MPAIIFYLLSARWAIVYLAQMKPLIVPILSEGEWRYPKWARCTFLVNKHWLVEKLWFYASIIVMYLLVLGLYNFISVGFDYFFSFSFYIFAVVLFSCFAIWFNLEHFSSLSFRPCLQICNLNEIIAAKEYNWWRYFTFVPFQLSCVPALEKRFQFFPNIIFQTCWDIGWAASSIFGTQGFLHLIMKPINLLV